MRIIVWGINYTPELTGIAPFNAGLCDYLKSLGHDVEMVTAFSYYPGWKKRIEDKGKLYRTDDVGGVRVHRCWNYVPSYVTTFRRIWHELSFGVTSLLRVIFMKRADVYVVVSPPLILGPAASLVCALKRRPYIFHVQDLQPDAAVGLGMVRVGHFTRLLYALEAWTYRHAAAISGISNGMLTAFSQKGVPGEKQWFSPNWIRSQGNTQNRGNDTEERLSSRRRFREKFGIPESTFVASYSGNLGQKQGIENLIAAALILTDQDGDAKFSDGLVGAASASGRKAMPGAQFHPVAAKHLSAGATPARKEILILVVGDGALRSALEKQLHDLKLRNVRLMPLLAEPEYHSLLAASDVSLILQVAGSGQYFFPSKLLSVLCAGLPVLSVADQNSELAKALEEGQFGLNVPPAKPAQLAAALAELAANPEQMAAFRQKTTWVDRYSGRVVLPEFERKLQGLALSAQSIGSRQ